MLVGVGFLGATIWGIVVTRAGFVSLGRGANALLGPDAVLVMLMVLFLGLAAGAAYGHLVIWPRVVVPALRHAAPQDEALTESGPETVASSKREPPLEAHETAAPQAAVAGGVEIYQSTLMHIWADGVVTEKEQVTLADLRRRLGVSDADHAALEKEVQEVLFPEGLPTNRSIYRATLEQIWADGIVTPKEQRVLEELRRHLAVSDEIHADLEAEVRGHVTPNANEEDSR